MAEFRRFGVGESTDEILDDGGEWWFGCGMKAKLFALFIALLMVGWGNSESKPDLTNTAPEKDPMESAVE